MTTPDPNFLAFFRGDWQAMLDAVTIPGMDNPSWDRRAAYLLWELANPEFDLADVRGIIRYIKTGNVNVPPSLEGNLVEYEAYGTFVPVGIDINHVEYEDCAPDPAGVELHFDATKVNTK